MHKKVKEGRLLFSTILYLFTTMRSQARPTGRFYCEPERSNARLLLSRQRRQGSTMRSGRATATASSSTHGARSLAGLKTRLPLALLWQKWTWDSWKMCGAACQWRLTGLQAGHGWGWGTCASQYSLPIWSHAQLHERFSQRF
jgi:hypothetical protein